MSIDDLLGAISNLERSGDKEVSIKTKDLVTLQCHIETLVGQLNISKSEIRRLDNKLSLQVLKKIPNLDVYI